MPEKFIKAGIAPSDIVAFNNGDDLAFKRIHFHYYNPLHFFAYKLTGDYHKSQDIASTVLAKLWQLSGRFETSLKIKAFLYISTRNACLNYMKKRSRESEWPDEDNYSQKPWEPWDLDTQKSFYTSELVQALLSIINELPERQSQVLKLWYLNDVPAEDIAKQMNISIDTVYGLKRNGIISLKKMLLEKKFDDLLILLVILENISK